MVMDAGNNARMHECGNATMHELINKIQRKWLLEKNINSRFPTLVALIYNEIHYLINLI